MKVLEYKQINKGAVLGSMNIQMDEWNDVIIRDIVLFQKDGKRWLSFPSRSYEKEGKREYFHYIRFEDKAKHDEWQQKGLKALQDYVNQVRQGGGSPQAPGIAQGQLKGTNFIPPPSNLHPHEFSEELPF